MNSDTDLTLGKLLIQLEKLKHEVAFYKEVIAEHLGFCDHCGAYCPIDLMSSNPNLCLDCYRPEPSMFASGRLQDEPQIFNAKKEDKEL